MKSSEANREWPGSEVLPSRRSAQPFLPLPKETCRGIGRAESEPQSELADLESARLFKGVSHPEQPGLVEVPGEQLHPDRQ